MAEKEECWNYHYATALTHVVSFWHGLILFLHVFLKSYIHNFVHWYFLDAISEIHPHYNLEFSKYQYYIIQLIDMA